MCGQCVNCKCRKPFSAIAIGASFRVDGQAWEKVTETAAILKSGEVAESGGYGAPATGMFGPDDLVEIK